MIVRQAKRLDSVDTYYFAKKLAEIAELNKEHNLQIINLGIGSPDLLPPEEVIATLKASASMADANKYQSYKGLPVLRSAFSNWYKRFFNVEIDSDKEVLPLMGSKEGIMHISMSLLNPGDEVLVPDPGYPTYRMTAALAGAESRFYNLSADNNWLPDLDSLSKQDLSKVKLIWINYPHMPTGAKADLPFYRSLLEFARENDILICHDNPYVFILNDAPLSILQVEGAKDHCIELVSLSKCYNMAGWRIGALIGHENAIKTVLKFKSNMASGMFRPLQEAAAKALSMDESWMRSLDNIYEQRKKIAHEIMDEIGAEYEDNVAGLFVWGRVGKTSQKVSEFCDEILYKAKVFITPGHIFGKNGEGYVRISLCSSEEIMNEALDRIRKSKSIS